MKIYKYKDRNNISGANIRRAREEQGIAQDRLAAMMQIEGVCVNQKAISRIETGERVVADYELSVFAKVLGKSVAALLGEE